MSKPDSQFIKGLIIGGACSFMGCMIGIQLSSYRENKAFDNAMDEIVLPAKSDTMTQYKQDSASILLPYNKEVSGWNEKFGMGLKPSK